MINKNLKTILFLIGWSMSFSALSQAVLTTAGGEGSVEGVHLSWTIGELITGTTNPVDEVTLTQGVQQPLMDITIPTIEFETEAYFLFQNTPNPFRTTTLIAFSLPRSTQIRLNVFDALGKKIITRIKRYEVGNHYETIDKRELGATGTYYYQLIGPNYIATKKMILVE